MLVLALAAALLIAPVMALGYAVLHEPYRPVFKRHRLSLPSTWPGNLSIVHISDLHVRRNDPRLQRAQRHALSSLTPDLLCVTGDVCEKARDIPLLVDILKAAR